MLEIFEPYIPFIVTLVTILINILLLVIKSPWYGYVIANVILIFILGFIGDSPFDIVKLVVDMIVDIFKKIFQALFNLLPTSCSS